MSGALPPPPPAPPASSTGETEWPLWVPPGQWVEWFGGTIHTGPERFVRNYTEAEIPLLVKAGAIIPMKGLEAQHEMAPERLILEAVWVAGVNGSGTVYEDAGDSLDYQKGSFSLTTVALSVGKTQTMLLVEGGSGQAAIGLPTQRRYEARFRGAPSSAADWEFQPEAAAVGSSWWWEDSVGGGGKTLVGVTAMLDSNATVTATFTQA